MQPRYRKSQSARRSPLRFAPMIIVAVLAVFAVTQTLGAGPFRSMDDCASCHVPAEKPGFSHARHADGRDCVTCHGQPDHSGGGLFGRSKPAGSAEATTGAFPVIRAEIDGVDEPSAIPGHEQVSCSTCHDMAVMECATCHTPPAEAHFEQQACTVCHAVERPFDSPVYTHVTFGAHTNMGEGCSSCHSPAEETKPSCRSCHGNSCGAGVTTMSGCLDCHRKGTTDRWLEVGADTEP